MSADTPWSALSEVYGFVGNSLLKPMTQTLSVGLDYAFWESFPDFGDEAIRACIDACGRYAEAAATRPRDEAVQQVAVEYTRLFVGPPSPAAPPWETMHRGEGVTVGFGQATFEMRELLREAGLELRNENRQYEDHMGIELLYLSECCRRFAAGEAADEAALDSFIERHPLSWIASLRGRVIEAFPDGYFTGLLALAQSVLEFQAARLSR